MTAIKLKPACRAAGLAFESVTVEKNRTAKQAPVPKWPKKAGPKSWTIAPTAAPPKRTRIRAKAEIVEPQVEPVEIEHLVSAAPRTRTVESESKTAPGADSGQSEHELIAGFIRAIEQRDAARRATEGQS